MISGGGIPTIDGDMDALAAHAREISTVGAAFAETGEQIHASWQGLSAVYEAPEAGQLLAATAPVLSVSASVGTDLESAGRALDTYAAEVREIKVRLDALRADADAFTQSVDGDDDWTEDGDKVDRNNQLIEAVNAVVAEFAERRSTYPRDGNHVPPTRARESFFNVPGQPATQTVSGSWNRLPSILMATIDTTIAGASPSMSTVNLARRVQRTYLKTSQDRSRDGPNDDDEPPGKKRSLGSSVER